MATAPQFDCPPRRSTRVATDILIEVKGQKFAYAGETVVVNLHGGLIQTAACLEVSTVITIFVHRTGKSARARVVFAPPDDPSHYGVELEQADNIWGLDPSPEDWEI